MIIYLYVKTHNKTGLKYLGMTSKPDPHIYPGSGHYWLRHLQKHGFDYSTEILKECSSKEELKKWGIYYSDLFNVVKSKNWANLKKEQGDGGRPGPEGCKKISKFMKGKTYEELYGDEIARKKKEKLKSRIFSKETRKRMSESKKGKFRGDQHNNFKGYYKTPWGIFGSAILASEKAPFKMNECTIRNWCINNDKKMSKHTLSRHNYFTDKTLGETFKNLGFDYYPMKEK